MSAYLHKVRAFQNENGCSYEDATREIARRGREAAARRRQARSRPPSMWDRLAELRRTGQLIDHPPAA
jgi:hypothetical protein